MLPPSAVQVKIVGGSLPVVSQNVFGNKTEHIKFDSCVIGDIQPLAFSDLPNMKTLAFASSEINRISPCGISSITDAESITFSNSRIQNIKPGAFHDIKGLTNITFSSSIIDNLESFGFHNVQAELISFNDAQISKIQSAAFSELHDVGSFVLSRISLILVEAGAFYSIRDIHSVQISGNFRGLHHKTLMELREATPGDHKDFSFENALVACDCRSAPLLEYIQKDPAACDESVRCAISLKSMRSVKPEEACPDYHMETFCVNVTLTPPSCPPPATQIASTAYQEVICPTKLADSRSSGTKTLTNLILCCFLTFGATFFL